MHANTDVFIARFGCLDDEQWLNVLKRSCLEPVIGDVRFPAFPNAATQQTFVGSSGEAALQEAFLFYRDIKQYAQRLGVDITTTTRILDFGCGWGRNYRFFLKDVLPSSIVGVDVDVDCVRFCNEHFPMGRFRACDPVPPLLYENDSFDIVYAYSVFSHLSEDAALRWVREFARIMRPGGMLIVTTLKQCHLEVWDQIRHTGTHWASALPNFDISEKKKGFSAGEFLYCPIGGGGVRTPDFYGEAIIPPSYAERAWAPHFRIVDYFDDPFQRPQAVLVAQAEDRASRK